MDFDKLREQMAFKASLPKMAFKVLLTAEQNRDREKLMMRVHMDSPDYFAAKKLNERIADGLQYCKNQNPGFNVELEIEVEPEQCYIVADQMGCAWGQAYLQTDSANKHLFHFDAKWWPHDQATFEKAARFYGIEKPEQYSYIPF